MDFKPNLFAGDHGEITPELSRALASADLEEIVGALGRVIVAVRPHARDDSCPDQELESVSLPGGLRATAIFSSFAALQAYDASARPMPMDIATVAQQALKSAGLLILDPGSAQSPVLGRSATIALATQTPWRAPWNDPKIAARISAALGGIPVELEGIGHTTVVLVYLSQVSRAQAQLILERAQRVIAGDRYVRSRLDFVEVRPVRAELHATDRPI